MVVYEAWRASNIFIQQRAVHTPADLPFTGHNNYALKYINHQARTVGVAVFFKDN